MSAKRFALALGALLIALSAAAPASAQDHTDANQLWEDFIHYSRIARLDLAAANGKALVDLKLEAKALLAAIEASPYADSFARDLSRMKQMAGEKTFDIASVATAVEQAVDAAKIAVIRDPHRIAAEIEKFDQGLRPRLLAIRRLKEAGEYATPQLLDVIGAETARQKQLRPYAIQALVDIGRPVVLPLCEALGDLPPVAQQDVARVLGQIGYPMAMPYLKELASKQGADAATKKVVEESLAAIAKNRAVSPEMPAATLFYMLAEDYYANHESLTLEPDAPANLLWYADERGELRYLRVPTAVYVDAMAMRSSKRALSLNRDLGEALSLWIAANFRRENRLPDGASDPSYGDQMRSPQFYAWSAGPTYVEPVLARALRDRDPDLALDAIESLARTAGNDAVAGQAEPLLTALRYPDRRVRFEAANAIAAAQPDADFTGSGRVVPVLAEAVRQGSRPVALVVAPTQEAQNKLAGTVRDAGSFDVIMSGGGEDLGEQLMTAAGVDVIVIQADPAFVGSFATARAKTYKIVSAPMVVMAAEGQDATITRMYQDDPTVFVTQYAAGAEQVAAQISEAMGASKGATIDAAAAERYATTALGMMRDLAIARSTVFDVKLAEAALIEALVDDRDSVAAGAAAVLSIIGGAEGQQATATALLDDARGTNLRIELLGSLAESARAHGTLITDRQAEQLRELVSTSRGRLADAAAAAYGALKQPSSRTTELISG